MINKSNRIKLYVIDVCIYCGAMRGFQIRPNEKTSKARNMHNST